MRKKEVIAAGIVILIAAIFLSGCVEKKPAISADYFPAKAGMEWSYKINFENTDPSVYFSIVYYPIKGGFLSDKLTSIPFEDKILSNGYKGESDCCRLKVRIKEVVFRGNKYSAKLDVIEDDLGVYVRSIYGNSLGYEWIVNDNENGFTAVKYADMPARDFNIITKDMTVTSPQLLFFSPKEIEEEKQLFRSDRIILLGYDNDAPGCEDALCMHFRRTVSGPGITEDTWFAPGKGLVRLEQKIDSEPSMTWVLESFKTS